MLPGKISYLIIGNGIAGVTAAEILRNEDSVTDITVIADDPFPVYYRPALKDYLAGRVREDKLWARPNSFYQDLHIRFLSDRVVGIQAGQHTIQMQSGREVAYDRLLLANGARASRLTCPGIDLVGVTTLRTVADYQAVVSHLGTARRIVVSGSGTLALETIETLRHRGYQVTHLMRRRTLWSEVLDATASDLVLQQERRDGVDVRHKEEIVEVMGKNGEVSGVITTSGARIACDMVIIAIGVEPVIDFIKSSGIPCGRGVQVDSAMHTSAPDIFAAGDILETTDIMTRRTRVIGQWYPAIQQARAAAYSMLDLLDTSYPFHSSTFYNATFLYGLDFASVGLSQIPKDGKDYQEIIADPLPRIYRKVILKDGVPVGMLSLGNRKDALAFKRSIDHKVNLSPVASQLFTGDFMLNDWLDREGVPPPVLGASRKGAVAVRQVAYAGGTTAGATILKPQPTVEALLIPIADVAQAQQRGMSQQLSNGQVLPPSGQAVLNADGSLLLPGATHALPADIVATFKENPALIVIAHGSPQVVSLKQDKSITLGRDKACNVVLADVAASRRHAEIFPGPDGFYIHDLGSANGVIVNQMKIDNSYLLVHGDRIVIGGIVIYFMNIRQEEPMGVIADADPGIQEQGQALICRNCGASNISIARFCVTCGTPVENSHTIIND